MTTRISPTGSTGFTLLELLVTLALSLALLGSLPLVLEPVRAAHQFLHVRDQLVTDLRRVGLEARKSGEVVTLTLAPDGSGYATSDSAVKRLLPEGIQIVPESPNRKAIDHVVSFYPSGQAETRRWAVIDEVRREVVVVDGLLGHVQRELEQ